MAEAPSDTSDHQRFDEMLVHLTPQGASVPYSIAFDPNGDIWVAAKGGLFKFDGKSRRLLFKLKNPFPNKMAPFCQLAFHGNTVVYTSAEQKEASTQIQFLELDGTQKSSLFVDGLIQSLVITPNGDMYCTKQMTGPKSSIYTTQFDAPIEWDELVSDEEHMFETLGVVDDDTIFVSTVRLPKHMNSKQHMRIIDVIEKKEKKRFSEDGKVAGKVYFPRSIKRLGDHMIILDKTGRFQRFTPEGEYVDTIAEVDAYLANGFALQSRLDGAEHDTALAAFSGVVREAGTGQAICDDWLEVVPFDHSSWKEKRKSGLAK